jgi:uncharacterized protein (DUF2141 family)
MRLKIGYAIIVLFIGLFFCFCAKEGIPPGGPIDYTPPEIALTVPPSNSIEVKIKTDIEINFSESMDREKTKNSIFITPEIGGGFEYKWKGKKLIIRLRKFLEENKTYVVTVGTSASDIHNNRLVKPYSFAFSTGKALDQGEIYGKVFSKENSSIWAYSINNGEEPNPSSEPPEYVTQSDNKGDYKLQYLSLGRYRVFAVQDLNNDLNWEIDTEPIGITTRDVNLTSEEKSQGNINFVVTKRDSTKISLLGCQVLDRNKLQLEFDKEPDSLSLFELKNYKVDSEIDSSQFVKINEIYLPTGQMKKPCLVIEGLKPKGSYKLVITNLTDVWSNQIDTSSNFCTFLGMDKMDTIPPSIFATIPKDKEQAVSLDAEIKFFFNEPMNTKSIESRFFLKDTSDVKIDGDMKWIDSVIFVFTPKDSLQGCSIYRAGLEGDKVFDLAGNHISDSLFKIVFTTVNPDTLGQLSGRIEVSDTSYKYGDIIVIATQTGSGLTRDYRKILKTAGSYKFTNLLPGKYVISAFIDLNGNGKLDLGNPFPFVLAEPQIFFADTITVRSRWETEGIDLIF